ncbi:uncharacterized protein BHQ10_002237 [Talaromyces amestolkiae]|uniref:Hydrophobin n=1 Tax=Talaromyces amestolkiae TaxID=1196081 RepID=A0A364KRQ8_TALAM|nr:uncharacterized protein BHQ10_002237 [Talaromyces amestolkiae]RAO66225.1 hypothetical protein BHQ10_002237 [Talaromyces amestolkiae]
MQLPSNLSLLLPLTILLTTASCQLLPGITASPSHAPSKQSKIGPWKCDLAQDGSGLPQQPYCCDEKSVKSRYQDGRILGVTDCTAVPADQNVQCAAAANVWCCYSLNASDPNQGAEWVCTSVAEWKPS